MPFLAGTDLSFRITGQESEFQAPVSIVLRPEKVADVADTFPSRYGAMTRGQPAAIIPQTVRKCQAGTGI